MSVNLNSSLSYASSFSASISTSKTTTSNAKNDAAKASEAEETTTEQTETTTDSDDTDSAVSSTGDATEQDTGDSGSGSGDGSGFDAKSILKEFKKALNDQLLKSMGLGSMDELQAAMQSGGISSLSISVQFELNYQSVSSVSGAATGTSLSLSLSASFELGSLSSGSNPFAASTDGTDATDASSANDPLASLRDYFSPEKTAQRILDFSLSFFGQSDAFAQYGDTEEGRGSFADMMGKAIQKGFDQALGILGDLPDQTSNEIDQTHQLVFDGLDKFTKNGTSDEDSGVYSQIQNFVNSYQLSVSYSSLNASVNTANGSANASSSSFSLQASYQQMQSRYSAVGLIPGTSSSSDVTA